MKKSIKDRFFAKTKASDTGCLEWTAATDKDGYGKFWDGVSVKRAHRFAYEYFIGPIGNDLLICHSCDNPKCVNPEHLWCGTNRQNMTDAKKKNRLASGEKNGVHIHPECRATGKRHGTALHPETIRRGNNHPLAILTEAQVVAIRSKYNVGGITTMELAREHGVSRSTISMIINRKTWKHI